METHRACSYDSDITLHPSDGYHSYLGELEGACDAPAVKVTGGHSRGCGEFDVGELPSMHAVIVPEVAGMLSSTLLGIC